MIKQKTYKVVYNACYGGFGLSNKAVLYLHDKFGLEYSTYTWASGREDFYLKETLERHDPRLVECVETLGSKVASGECARLEVEEISSSVYRISEYDGLEQVLPFSSENYTIIYTAIE